MKVVVVVEGGSSMVFGSSSGRRVFRGSSNSSSSRRIFRGSSSRRRRRLSCSESVLWTTNCPLVLAHSGLGMAVTFCGHFYFGFKVYFLCFIKYTHDYPQMYFLFLRGASSIKMQFLNTHR
jgi:hypothetical protein